MTKRRLLVKYVGWGAMPQVFDDFNPLWLEQREALRKELTKRNNEFAAQRHQCHYTSPIVIGAMYRALERFGFQGGRILEPASGIGHFIGIMPEGVFAARPSRESRLTR